MRPTSINWDAVQFELALGRFDLHAHQPHPPGYLLYVLAGRLTNALVSNPGLALSLLSVLSSALAVPLLYRLGMRVFEDRAVALGAALFLLGSPLALFYGSVGLTYAPEMALSLAVASLAWRMKSAPAASTGALLGVALGIAGGVRQTSLIVLLPLVVWALWGTGRRLWLPGAGAALLVCAAWMVPLLALSGGPASYLRESALLAQTAGERTALPTAGLEGLGYNVGYEALGLGLGLAFALVPLGLWVCRLLRFSLSRPVKAFVFWWVAPPLTLFAVAHLGQYGYLLVVLPPLALLASLCVRLLAEKLRLYPVPFAPVACAVLALASAAYFTLGRGPVTASAIATNDRHWAGIRAALSAYDPAHTALVMGLDWEGPFRLAGYLLPAFHSYSANVSSNGPHGWLYSAHGGVSTYALPRPPAEPYLALPPGTSTVVALDDKLGAMLAQAGPVKRIALEGGPIYLLQAGQGHTNIEGIILETERLRVRYGQQDFVTSTSAP